MNNSHSSNTTASDDSHTSGYAERFLWRVKDPVPQSVLDMFPQLEPQVVQLLHNRGITTQEEVDGFLQPDYGQDQHDPFLFRDMQKAVERIQQAVEKKEKIVIHGDYDADGVCASSVLWLTLKEIGADANVYLPHRDTEGYGLNMETVQKLADEKTNLIITVDCGISNKPEVSAAVAAGMEVIVTDHHSEPPELPTDALAIINPKVSGESYPFKYLAGVGVAFKLSQALLRTYDKGEAFEKWLLDLVAISTVTDFVELIGENRVLLKYGLIVLQKNKRLGLQRLNDQLGIDPKTITTETIGFKIGPHINAAGRVGHANAALDLVIETDPAKATEYAIALSKTNKERQALSEQMSKAALAQAELQQDEQVIIVESSDWPVGLVGLVAGKVSSTYHRPTFVITTMNTEIVGSGRSIEHFNLVEAIQSMPDVFSKFGGHPMACGFTLKDAESFEEFKRRMRERGHELLDGKDLRNFLDIEAALTLDQVDWTLVTTVEQCAPYGQANPQPLFVSHNVSVAAISTVGKKKDHLRVTVEQNNTKRQCIAFGLGSLIDQVRIGQLVDVVYTVSVNEWNGNREIQLEIKDVKVHA